MSLNVKIETVIKNKVYVVNKVKVIKKRNYYNNKTKL
jgi:hypothetical protein